MPDWRVDRLGFFYVQNQEGGKLMSGLMTRQEVADYLKMSVVSVNKFVMEGTIPYLRIGPRSVRFDSSEIAKWARSRKNVPYHKGGRPKGS